MNLSWSTSQVVLALHHYGLSSFAQEGLRTVFIGKNYHQYTGYCLRLASNNWSVVCIKRVDHREDMFYLKRGDWRPLKCSGVSNVSTLDILKLDGFEEMFEQTDHPKDAAPFIPGFIQLYGDEGWADQRRALAVAHSVGGDVMHNRYIVERIAVFLMNRLMSGVGRQIQYVLDDMSQDYMGVEGFGTTAHHAAAMFAGNSAKELSRHGPIPARYRMIYDTLFQKGYLDMNLLRDVIIERISSKVLPGIAAESMEQWAAEYRNIDAIEECDESELAYMIVNDLHLASLGNPPAAAREVAIALRQAARK